MERSYRTGTGPAKGGVPNRRRRQRGFTLIELGVVLAVLAILVAIAVPTYLRMVARAREAEAQQAWSMVKAELWSYYLQNNGFPADSDNDGWPDPIDKPQSPHWNYSAASVAGGIKVTANPTSQNNEVLCWTLSNTGSVSSGRGSQCQ